MKQLTDFSRIHFGVLPTPLYKLENLSREFGKNIYIKRDDMIGVALGGNKVRKLEFMLAQAKAQGCDTVITTGGAQSNHAMLTAACAARTSRSRRSFGRRSPGMEEEERPRRAERRRGIPARCGRCSPARGC